jgi:hypothetical protein
MGTVPLTRWEVDMPLFEFSPDAIRQLAPAEFAELGLFERADLQRLLRDRIDVIAPDTLIISEEFSSWDRSDRRIDLLGVDRHARLVVVELKRTTDDGHVDLQALRYAAMVAKMTFGEAVETFRRYNAQRQIDEEAQSRLLEFLGWEDPADGRFGEDVRIVLAAPGFSPEVTSTVLWLNEHDLDFRCVRLQPYRLGNTTIVDAQQIIPLPEAADYQVQIRQKQRETREAAEHSVDWTRYDVRIDGELHRRLYKREVIFVVCRHLVAKGVAPEEIERSVGRRTFEGIDGEIDGASFRAELAKRRPNDARAVNRFFSADDQLIHFRGKTYAVSNQWSKGSMESAMDALLEKFKSHAFTYGVAATSDASELRAGAA